MKRESRFEKYMEKFSGKDVNITPRSRRERYFNEIAENVGSADTYLSYCISPITYDT